MKQNLISLPLSGFAPDNSSLADHLEELAREIRDDESAARNIVVIIESMDGMLTRRTFGQPCDLARVVGLLFIAATRSAVGG